MQWRCNGSATMETGDCRSPTKIYGSRASRACYSAVTFVLHRESWVESNNVTMSLITPIAPKHRNFLARQHHNRIRHHATVPTDPSKNPENRSRRTRFLGYATHSAFFVISLGSGLLLEVIENSMFSSRYSGFHHGEIVDFATVWRSLASNRYS